MENNENIVIDVVGADGAKVGSRSACAYIFDAPVKRNLLHQVVRWHLAKARSGTHACLTRAAASGGGAKPWKQKGTGRARAGSNTSPLWVGGGIAHGPKPRKYGFRLNKLERQQALSGALSARLRENRLLLLKDLELSEAKTKTALKVLRALGIEDGDKVAVVLDDKDANGVMGKSLRNIRGLKMLTPMSLNVYDVLNSQYLVILESVMSRIESRFGVGQDV